MSTRLAHGADYGLGQKNSTSTGAIETRAQTVQRPPRAEVLLAPAPPRPSPAKGFRGPWSPSTGIARACRLYVTCYKKTHRRLNRHRRAKHECLPACSLWFYESSALSLSHSEGRAHGNHMRRATVSAPHWKRAVADVLRRTPYPPVDGGFAAVPADLAGGQHRQAEAVIWRAGEELVGALHDAHVVAQGARREPQETEHAGPQADSTRSPGFGTVS